MGGGVDHSGAGSEDVHHASDDVLESPVVGVDHEVCLLSKCRQAGVRLLISACIVHQDVQSLMALSGQSVYRADKIYFPMFSLPDELLHVLYCLLV